MFAISHMPGFVLSIFYGLTYSTFTITGYLSFQKDKHRWCDSEKVSDLSKVTQLGSSRAGAQTQFSASKVMLLTTVPC